MALPTQRTFTDGTVYNFRYNSNKKDPLQKEKEIVFLWGSK